MTTVSKNAYIDKLDDMVSEYTNTYRTIKMKPIDVKDNKIIHTLIQRKKLMIKIQNLKLGIM